MNSEQIENRLLINEWQLGAQLNVAVTNGTRDKFNLLLSLLSDDVRDFAQFSLPKATLGKLTELELRESLSLPEAQPLVNQGLSLQQSEKISIALHQKKTSSIRLQSLLNNEAILSRIHHPTFDPDVLENLSFVAQQRLMADENKKEMRPAEQSVAQGIDSEMMQQYQQLDLANKPVQVTYM